MDEMLLIVSDVHINDYPNRNPKEKYRLYQTRVVAQNIIEAGKNYGADTIVFAGDILEKAINRPYILAEVKLFLDTVMNNFKRGFIIWGNHDQDNKGNDQDTIDSSLWVMLPPNLYYADKKEIVIGNTRIAFSNWYPKFDLSWIQGCVDLLITHATIDYSSNGKDPHLKAQNNDLDQSKFSLAICGDIHKMAQTGKFVSIGVPQKCKMGDSNDASGIIYNCTNKTWEWVNLNPHDNLMKFEYTSDIHSDGWNPDNGTWYQYQPSNIISSSGVNEIQIPVWDDINNLINDIIDQNGLTDIHRTILSYLNNNVEYREVDFNFSIKKLHCENWRSIDNYDFYFDEGDRILIQGKNGSGKSSLLSAIKYALIEYPGSLKDFIQFGCKSCLTELTLEYQGILYKISRGFKSGKPVFGLEIDGNPQKYNNKKEFDEDIHLRFPFIDYMEVYFFNSDHSRLIGDPEIKKHPEKLAELISKFFKLDKIDAYNDTSMKIKEDCDKTREEWEIKKKASEDRLGLIQSELNSITLPGIDKESCVKYKEEGLQLQEGAKMWMNYINTITPLQANIDLYNSEIERLKSEIGELRDKKTITSEIDQISARISSIDSEILNLRGAEKNYALEYGILMNILSEARKIRAEIDNLDKSNICPTCHKPLTSQEDLDTHKNELQEKLNSLGVEYGNKKAEVDNLLTLKETASLRVEELGRQKNQLQQELTSRTLELEKERRLKEEKENKENNLKSFVNRLESLTKPEEIVIPDDFTEKMMELDRSIRVWETYENLCERGNIETVNIKNYETELEKISQGVDRLGVYIKLTSPTGKIYEEIMGRLAKQFTDNDVKYEVESYNFKRKDHLALKCYYNNNGNYVPYDTCSDGQKTVLDVHFLSKIVTRMGLLVMDEFLKHLDPGNHELCIAKVAEMNIGCILLSSHMESVGGFNNKTCNLELNDSGLTKINVK